MNEYSINIRRLLLVFGLLTYSIAVFSQSDWEVPDDKKAVTSPVTVSADLLEKGADLFTKNCASCHGEIGTESYLPLTPSPGDPASERFQVQTSGALFYKITSGRVAMPSFDKTLSEDERWTIIAYIKSFGDNPDQQVAETAGFAGKVNLKMKLAEETKDIVAIVTQADGENAGQGAEGIAVQFFVQRTFGMMELSDGAVKTNAKGYAKIHFPETIKGDTAGMVQIIVKLKDRKYKGIEATEQVKWTEPNVHENLLDQRALWGTNANAPLWLIFMYLSVVIGVWSFIGYIVYQLFLLRKAGA